MNRRIKKKIKKRLGYFHYKDYRNRLEKMLKPEHQEQISEMVGKLMVTEYIGSMQNDLDQEQFKNIIEELRIMGKAYDPKSKSLLIIDEPGMPYNPTKPITETNLRSVGASELLSHPGIMLPEFPTLGISYTMEVLKSRNGVNNE